MQPQTNQIDTKWRADASIAYAILRLTLGINICIRGVMRVAHGTDAFVARMFDEFQATFLTETTILVIFGHLLPWVESIIGLLMIVGLFSRFALISGGLMMAVLTFGTMLQENYGNGWLLLGYGLVFFVLLSLHSLNRFSCDTWIQNRRTTAKSSS